MAKRNIHLIERKEKHASTDIATYLKNPKAWHLKKAFPMYPLWLKDTSWIEWNWPLVHAMMEERQPTKLVSFIISDWKQLQQTAAWKLLEPYTYCIELESENRIIYIGATASTAKSSSYQ
ncbi:hypothetical protein [Listeria grayi]|uniref:hypothetical protein n=1 Tax=Listeria grayi TaxID=1641 RepID=UPI00162A48D2|nr:hypothetical protein [Listeria grayi]MBC1922995.1 hypothetical protein [Listeria grayi]